MALSLMSILIYGWLVFASFLSVYWGFVIIFTRKWTKRILTAKLFKTPLDFECKKGRSVDLKVTRWKDGNLINEKGEPIQDFKNKDKDEVESNYFYCDGVRMLIRPEGSLTCVDNMFKPCLINQTWLDNYIQRQKIRIELGKKWFKSKARQFPLFWILLFIGLIALGYVIYYIFWG